MTQRRMTVSGLLAVLALALVPAAQAGAANVTFTASELAGGALDHYSWIVNKDNTHLWNDANPLDRPGVKPTESNTPVVAEGVVTGDAAQDLKSANLDPGRYLVSVRSPNHKMWGRHFTVGASNQTIDVALREASEAHPLPLGRLKIQVFEDNAWTNAAPDDGEVGLAGFKISLTDQSGNEVTDDYYNTPLCGGECLTGSDGYVEIPHLAPGTYLAEATPPDGSGYVQTTSIGGFALPTGVEEGSDGTGTGGQPMLEGGTNTTSYWFGFVKPTNTLNGAVTITGTARNWQGWPPYDRLTYGEPVSEPYVALTDSSTDQLVYLGRGDVDGNFSIPGARRGATYMVAVWDEQLSYITRFFEVTVPANSPATVEIGEDSARGAGDFALGVSRWFAWLEGDVFLDNGGGSNNPDLVGNGLRDPGEPGIPNTDVDMRWRDGSISDAGFTDGTGHYIYSTVEGGQLGKWAIGEVGFSRYATTGPSVHDEFDPDNAAAVDKLDTSLGGGLLTNQHFTEGHRSIVDWGKLPYAQGVPGQIVGVAYHATTRNETDPRNQAHEDYEPGIPDVEVRLESVGGDGLPNTADDFVVNDYTTDHWSQPPNGPDGKCVMRDLDGNAFGSGLNPELDAMSTLIGDRCLEVPMIGASTKDGAFDGGYAFADFCPNGYDFGASDADNPCWSDAAHSGHTGPADLVPGKYVTHVVMPKDANGRDLYQITKEEDVNVDLGATFEPAITPPPCVGDDHVVPANQVVDRSPYGGQTRKLCDKVLIDLKAQQNANADFNLFTNLPHTTEVQVAGQPWQSDVAIPGRMIGFVSNDVYFDHNIKSIWYGEPRPEGGVPIGIYDYAHRLLTTVETDENGSYEAVLPSTETFNCPTPQGVCPGMYDVVINDPGSKDHPNPDYRPELSTDAFAWDVWPGQTTQMDTPVIPTSGVSCQLPATTPELMTVNRPWVRNGPTANDVADRTITIKGQGFGSAAAGNRVFLDNPRTGFRQTLTNAAAGNPLGRIVSWAPDQIQIRVPQIGVGSFIAGPQQLTIQTAAGSRTVNGITLHVLGTGYNPTVRNVAAPGTLTGAQKGHELQAAINAAASPTNAQAGDLLVLAPGVYTENVVVKKRVTIQGIGPGAALGTLEAATANVPVDPPGSVIDGRFFSDNSAAWHAALGSDSAPEGAAITVVPPLGAYVNDANNSNPERYARIDGVGIQTGHGAGAGGIQVMHNAHRLQITNDILQGNNGEQAGAIALGLPTRPGQPTVDNNDRNVDIKNDRILGNGAGSRLTAVAGTAGAIGIYNGADLYEIANSLLCANASFEYGGAIGHYGRSNNGSIHDNQIYFNDAVDSGGGIALNEEIKPLNAAGDGTGPVSVQRNLIQGNISGDDGGGIFLAGGRAAGIAIDSNMIVTNAAADAAGGIMLDDSHDVRLINNTVAQNITTATSEQNANGTIVHAAGLVSEKNSQNNGNSIPTALYNNIFWANEMYVPQAGTPPTLVPAPAALAASPFRDFELLGSTGTFSPRFSVLTAPFGTGSNNTIVGPAGNPGFVTPYELDLNVTASRLDPQAMSVAFGGDVPPAGLAGNYHITATSPARNRGVTALGEFPAPTVDIDGGIRNAPYDAGADEYGRP